MASKLTVKLRYMAALFWSLGFALVVFDYFYLWEIKNINIRLSYLLFFLAGGACCWAENREFGLRVALGHFHDIATSSPWKYLLLYFLWVNLFAPFTENPQLSVLYACGGWFSLLVVAFSARLIFCEYSIRGVRLVPVRLKVLFSTYCISVILLSISYFIFYLLPGWGWSPLSRSLDGVSLYFLMGFPFFLWDFLNPKRQLLPKWLLALAIMCMIGTLFLLKNYLFLFGMALAVLGLLALGIYKRLRFIRSLGYLSLLCLFFLNFLFLYSKIPTSHPAKGYIQGKLDRSKSVVSKEVEPVLKSLESVHQSLMATNYLGVGIGNGKLYRGVWLNVLSELGIIGLFLYSAFFVSLMRQLYFIRRSSEIIVSNIAFISLMLFLLIGSHYAHNPYSISVWIWYALWGILGTTHLKRPVSLS